MRNGSAESTEWHGGMICRHEAGTTRADPGVPQSPPRQHTLGPVRTTRRRHLRYDGVQGRNNMGQRIVAALCLGRALPRARLGRNLTVDRCTVRGAGAAGASGCLKPSDTAASSRAISQPMACGSFPKRSTSWLAAIPGTCSCRCTTITPATTTVCTGSSTAPTGPAQSFLAAQRRPVSCGPVGSAKAGSSGRPTAGRSWSHHHHISTWWKSVNLPNVLFVHYADLKADIETEVRRIAPSARSK